MADLAVITPTRGRPQQFVDMCRSVLTLAEGTVEVWAGLDLDDDFAAYRAALSPDIEAFGDRGHIRRGDRKSLSAWTNELAREALDSPDPPRYFASLGDDHRPRTPAWDRKLIAAIEARGGSGFAYGNDLLQGAKLPTAWVVSADIVRALGWLMLPNCAHMYVDNATLTLGRKLGLITYVPGVVIEHMHPAAGKAGVDASYAESNAPARYSADLAAFEAWRDADAGLAADADRVRFALGMTVHDVRRLVS